MVIKKLSFKHHSLSHTNDCLHIIYATIDVSTKLSISLDKLVDMEKRVVTQLDLSKQVLKFMSEV